jgi:predicted RNA-binding Zn-ribbon protein involved in translation (DUF1610 family)
VKIILTESQVHFIEETVKKNNRVVCDKCDHSWGFDEGGSDPYICHKCGFDNEKKKDETAKWIKCDSCDKRFTQTIYKKKKSKPICPYCGKLNETKKF